MRKMKIYAVLSPSCHSPYSSGNHLAPIICLPAPSELTLGGGGHVTQAEQTETLHPTGHSHWLKNAHLTQAVRINTITANLWDLVQATKKRSYFSCWIWSGEDEN